MRSASLWVCAVRLGGRQRPTPTSLPTALPPDAPRALRLAACLRLSGCKSLEILLVRLDQLVQGKVDVVPTGGKRGERAR